MEHTDSHINLHFVAGEDGMQFAHTALVHLLSFESPREGGLHWRGILRREQVTASVGCFSAALDAAYRQKVVSHVFYLHPHVMPDFL